jgi:hypothetical protein
VGAVNRTASLKRTRMRRAAARPLPAPVKRDVVIRSKGQCEVVDMGARCPEWADDFHHLVKRSQGGRRLEHPDWIAHVCRAHHDHADNRGFSDKGGRLVGIPLGRGMFAWVVIEAPKQVAKDRIAQLIDLLGGLRPEDAVGTQR